MPVDARVIALYNEYVHSQLPRRDFLERLAKIAGGAAAAAAVLPLVEPNYAWGRQVETDDRRLEAGHVEYPGRSGKVRAYLARPREARGKLPGIVVIHENRGLNEHIEDVARRAALAGYVALAPDGLSLAGGAPQDQEAARDAFAKADRSTIAADILAAVPFLAAHERCTGRLGTVGFCYGGGMALRCALDSPQVAAAVGFYGSAPSAEEVARLKAAVMMHYAGTDERINAGIPEFRAALDKQGIAYSIHMYPGTQHGFHNDSSAARYDEAAARLAWSRTMDFFAHSLAGRS